jgi:hypothetical protein
MAHFNDEGWLVADEGDPEIVRQEAPAATLHGKLATETGWPDLFVTHRTATDNKYGVTDPIGDGTQGMADRIEAGSKPYIANFYVSRSGKIFQVAPVTQIVYHTEGSWKGRLNNNHSFSAEFTSIASVKANGAVTGINKAGQIDMTRDDMVKRDGSSMYDQKLTDDQLRSGAVIVKAMTAKSGFGPSDDTVKSHKQIGSGGHDDIGVPWSDLAPFVTGLPYQPPFQWLPVLLGAALLTAAGTALYLHQTRQRPRWLPTWVPT